MRAATRKWTSRAKLYVEKRRRGRDVAGEYRSRFTHLDKFDAAVHELGRTGK